MFHVSILYKLWESGKPNPLNMKQPRTSSFQNVMRIILGAFMVLAGVGHLSFQRREFQAQVPRWLSNNEGFIDFVVIASGVVEILLGLAMIFWVSRKRMVGIVLAIFFILVFPGNISQYTNGIDAFGLDTDNKRLIRLFFQPVLILWALWSTGGLRNSPNGVAGVVGKQ